jgi:hypothetical protein
VRERIALDVVLSIDLVVFFNVLTVLHIKKLIFLIALTATALVALTVLGARAVYFFIDILNFLFVFRFISIISIIF